MTPALALNKFDCQFNEGFKIAGKASNSPQDRRSTDLLEVLHQRKKIDCRADYVVAKFKLKGVL